MRVVLLFILFAISTWTAIDGAMSEAQLKAALKLLRNVCQPKNKATDEQIEGMHKGNWDLDKNGKCYLWCILNMYKLITKENEFAWEAGIQTIQTQAPESIRATALKAVTSCKDAVKTPGEKCEAAYEIAHCVYLADPEHYFLP